MDIFLVVAYKFMKKKKSKRINFDASSLCYNFGSRLNSIQGRSFECGDNFDLVHKYHPPYPIANIYIHMYMSIFLMALGPGSKIFEWLKKYICILLTKSCFDKEMVIFIPFNMFKLCIIHNITYKVRRTFFKGIF